MTCPACHQNNAPTARFCRECGTKLPVLCPKCGVQVLAAAKFCEECGASLRSSKPAIPPGSLTLEQQFASFEADLPDTFREQLLPHEEGENRLVTVLFADMSRSVETTRDLHPEDAAAFVNRLLKAMLDALLKYEGCIDRFLGDGLLTVFGAPQARESDPERAIRAALEIQDAAHQLGLDASVGINTGEVYVGEMGTERRQWVTVMGPVVNLASRLQGLAEPGQILVGEATYRQTRGAFAFAPVELAVKGISRPVVAYAVERALPRPEKPRGIEGLRAELIGRDEEMATLQGLLAAVARGRGQIVTLTGEAGVGKSRLVSELRALADRRAHPGIGAEAGWKSGVVTDAAVADHTSPVPLASPLPDPVSLLWLAGRCPEIGMTASYSPFVELFQDYLAWRRGQPADVLGRRSGHGEPPAARSQGSDNGDGGSVSAGLLASLHEIAARGDLPYERAEEIALLLANLLSLRLDDDWEGQLKGVSPEQLKYQTFRAVQDFFVSLARHQPVVLVLEDLHWSDSLSLELLYRLMELLPHAPLLLLCVYRPDLEHPIRALGARAAQQCAGCSTEIHLRELSPAQTVRLVESLLTRHALPDSIWQAILEKTHGNPFFVEETVRSLIASGLLYREEGLWRAREGWQVTAVPESIQSVILSRVDRLDRELRHVLQGAAVIGHVFDPQVLARVTPSGQGLPRALAELERHGFLYPARSGAAEVYTFKHSLSRETVYEMILRRRRAGLHRQVAEAIEALFPDRAEEIAEELARHYSLSDCLPKAVEWLLKAGQKAQRLYANQEAIRCFESALSYFGKLPDEQRDPKAERAAHERLGEALFRIGDHPAAEEQFQQALHLASPLQEARPVAALMAKLADAIHWQVQPDRAIQVAEAGLSLLDEDLSCPEAVNLLEVIMRSCWDKGDQASERHYAARLRGAIDQVPYFDAIYMSYYALAWAAVRSGDFDTAEQWLQAMERVCQEHGNENGLARCYHGLGDLWCARDDHAAASYWLARSLEFCERTGDAHLLVEGHLERAHSLICVGGRAEEVEKHIQRGLRIAREMAGTRAVSSIHGLCEMLGDAFAGRGEYDQAIRYLRQVIEFGPHPVRSARALGKLERHYVRQNRREEFLAFCRRAQPLAFPPDHPLRFWHLAPASPDPGLPRLTWSDPFDVPELREGWQWVDPAGSARWELLPEQGLLVLRTLAARGQSPAGLRPHLRRPVSGDFAAETLLVGATGQKCHSAGLLLWAAPGHNLTFGRAFPAVHEVNLAVCRQGRSETIGRGYLDGGDLHLRLERLGERVIALCSNDGRQWHCCGETGFSTPDGLEIGLYVACPALLTVSEARFRGLRLSAQEAP
jgi:adenylate cyclase